MDFIEQLKLVGGVKPCPKCKRTERALSLVDLPMPEPGMPGCELCNSTGTVLDLAPLLARPELLDRKVGDLCYRFIEDDKKEYYANREKNGYGHYPQPHRFKNLIVVGPQRANSLVYEVARQLGGTAVVAEPIEVMFDCKTCTHKHENDCGGCVIKRKYGVLKYRLSLPIPPDATVLFVTDRVHQKEMYAIMEHVMTSVPKDKPHKFLPYLLALVSEYAKWEFPDPEETQWQVISLHKERA
jgi:hypothetical protein